MKNAQRLKDAMKLGRVYRRQDLKGLTTAVDRDLKTLVKSGEVRKLGYGLYCRPRKDPFGETPPEEQELVRAFLKTDDFLLTSDKCFTQLGLGLAQLQDDRVVYNHKRSGEFVLGGRRFRFRVVPAYPKKLSKEYLLVDLLNNLKRLPGDPALVLSGLKYRMDEFDSGMVGEHLARYGRPAARAALARVARERRAEMPVRVVAKEDDRDDLRYWQGKSAAERVGAVEFLREQFYALSGLKTIPRLARVIRVVERPE